MRRKEKEVIDIATMESIIKDSMVCRMALCRNNQPYVVPLCFGYEEGKLYIHCAREGMKNDMLLCNDSVCVEFESDVELVVAESPCDCGMRYKSVIAFGRASLLEDTQSIRAACDAIMRQYSPGDYEYTDAALNRLSVFRIDIDRMTGKQSGY